MKRNIIKPLWVMGVAGGLFFLSSCLKNNKYYVDFSKYTPSVELPFAATNLNGPYGMSWSTDTTTSWKVYINVASVNPLNKAVTATLGIDTGWVSQYNAQQTAAAQQTQQTYLQDTSHHVTDPSYPYSWIPMEVLPDSLYTITVDGKTVNAPFQLSVPAGQREVYANVLVKTNEFPGGHNYVLPFTITQGSINISSWNHEPLWFVSSPFSGTFTKYHSIITGGATADFTDVVTLNTVDQHTVSQNAIGDYFGGYTLYHFNGDGSISVEAGTSASSPNAYGAKVLSSSSDQTTGNFHVQFSILGGAYVFDETFNR